VNARRRLAAGLAITSSLLVAACGGQVVEQAGIESEAQALLEDRLGVKVVGVTCPEDVPVEAEEEFDCDAEISSGESVTVTAQVTDPEAADIEITAVN